MIVEYIRYKIQEEHRAAFEAAYEQAFAPLLRSPYCLAAELSRCTEEQASYILRIEWTSQEDHLKGFRSSPEFQEFLSLIRDYIPNIQEMRHYASIQQERKN
jgi:quinol monooxygenase YgiN